MSSAALKGGRYGLKGGRYLPSLGRDAMTFVGLIFVGLIFVGLIS